MTRRRDTLTHDLRSMLQSNDVSGYEQVSLKLAQSAAPESYHL